MANSKARCSGCRKYFPRAELSKVGLVSVCSTDCRTTVLSRVKNKEPKRVAKRNGNVTGHSGLHQRVRQSIRKRDGNICRWCQQPAYRLEVHHVFYRSQGGPDHGSNLITLCDEHHSQAHSKKKLWQRVLLAVIWAHYVEKKYYTVPQMEKRLRREGLLDHDNHWTF